MDNPLSVGDVIGLLNDTAREVAGMPADETSYEKVLHKNLTKLLDPRITAALAAARGEEREALLAVLLRHKSEIQSQVLKHYPDKSEQSKNLQGELLRQERLLLNIMRDLDELTNPGDPNE